MHLYLGCSSLSAGVGTHDEMCTTTGINKWFLKNVAHSRAEIAKEEKEKGMLKGLEFIRSTIERAFC
jgi:hypothetical protein